MAKYMLCNNDIAINSQQNLTTTYKTLLSITAATGATTLRRAWLYDVMVGTDGTPADNAVNWIVNRQSTVGTATSHTAAQQDAADAAPLMTTNVNHTIEPTVTDQTGAVVPRGKVTVTNRDASNASAIASRSTARPTNDVS